jgi:hypothetical protein
VECRTIYRGWDGKGVVNALQARHERTDGTAGEVDRRKAQGTEYDMGIWILKIAVDTDPHNIDHLGRLLTMLLGYLMQQMRLISTPLPSMHHRSAHVQD